MPDKYHSINNLKVSEKLLNFVNDDLLEGTGVSPENFWLGFDKAVHELAPKNKELIQIRKNLQTKIDNWHIKNKGNDIDIEQYKNFLKEIGYLKKEGDDFKIETKNVDDEIALIAGPQLVVPIMNARYTLNAANARWVSLYDSLYGTNIIESEEGGSGGAIALASSSKVLMFENAIYSVISPEGCATILWRDPKKMLDAAKAMKLSAKELLELQIIDEIILEPLGGAHRDKNFVLKNLKNSILKNLEHFKLMSGEEIFTNRKNKFLRIGRNKGFMNNLEDLSSLESVNNSFYETLKLKKFLIPATIILFIILTSIITFL